jgi:hypothetical protein
MFSAIRAISAAFIVKLLIESEVVLGVEACYLNKKKW